MTEGPQREPAWLTHMVDQHLALVAEATAGMEGFGSFGVVMMTLTEPPEDASDEEIDRWERTCDRCGRWCPDGDEFYSGSVTRELDGTQVIMSFGLCGPCVRRG